MKRTAWALLFVAAFIIPTVPADAQLLPLENHYKTYDTGGPQWIEQIWLHDQFGDYQIDELFLEKFANPVDKNQEGIVEPIVHQTWWRLFATTLGRRVTATDQFGTHVWTVLNPAYLLVPALKNDFSQQLPEWNHYLCYEAFGPVPGVEVTLADQFGTLITIVLEGRYFCNPVEKARETGEVFPIIDPGAHLTCYFIDDPNIYGLEITALDQFGEWILNLDKSDCLCLPALKEDVVGSEESTWGRIKALYR
jgi:hypothetical protein